MKITIIGAGSWGATLAILPQKNGYEVKLWSRHYEESLESTLIDTEMIISAVSMSGVNSIAEQIKNIISSETILVTATKGLDTITTNTPSQIWQKTLPKNPIVVLSGPNLAKEIQKGLPAATVVASHNIQAAETVQKIFSSPVFRVYTNNDPLGVELGGTLKNVMAIAAGCCDGLQLGTNAKAALLTRGLTEMIRIGNHWGAKTETFYGLSGLGDLLATCNSSLSRNYQVGYQLAQGKKLGQILTDLQGTAEGVNTTQVLMQKATSEKIYVPIAYQVARLLKGEITPQTAVEALMLRENKPE
jgi:glycerol-3-phosphate dehydrogenase (NAD(P)+)